MRILQVHNFYRIPGGECGVVHAERALLEEHGHVLSLFSRNSGDLPGYSIASRALNYAQIPYNPGAARSLEQIVRKFRPDVAHIHNVFPLLSPSIYITLEKQGVPVVQTLHNYRLVCPNGLLFTHGRVCRECLDRGLWSAIRHRCVRGNPVTSALYGMAISFAWRSGSLTNRIHRYIALNSFCAELMAGQGIPRDRIRICGNFTHSFVDRPESKHPYFLYLGRLSPEKGLWTLMKALRHSSELHVKIAGQGPIEKDLREYAATHLPGQVDFLGHIDGEKKSTLLSHAMASVLPSECNENFPLSIVESLAHATPAIVSRIGGLPEMIEPGRTGYLVEPGQTGDLADTLLRISGNPALAAQLAETSLSVARNRFSPTTHYNALMEIYMETVREARGAGVRT